MFFSAPAKMLRGPPPHVPVNSEPIKIHDKCGFSTPCKQAEPYSPKADAPGTVLGRLFQVNPGASTAPQNLTPSVT